MRDYNYTFESFDLPPFEEIRKTAPGFNERSPSGLDVELWLEQRGGYRDRARITGLKGIPIEITRAKLNGVHELIYELDEVAKDPDEVYLFKGKRLYYYTYFKFYRDVAVMLDVSFSTEQPFRVDRLREIPASEVDKFRKGVLYYGKTTAI